MKTLEKYIDEKVKEQRELLRKQGVDYGNPEDEASWQIHSEHESFLTTALTECAKATAEAIRGEEKELPRRFDCVDCCALMEELDRDDLICAICNGERGFNVALAEIKVKEREWFGE